MIEDHTHCIQCGKVCYYPDNPIEVQVAITHNITTIRCDIDGLEYDCVTYG